MSWPTREEKKLVTRYKVRNETLSTLGYSSYKTYLESEDWKQIRERILLKYRQCILCGHMATQIHHIRYDYATMLGLREHCLAPLCRDCHKGIEFIEGEKATLAQANVKLFKDAMKTQAGKEWRKNYFCGCKEEKRTNKKKKINEDEYRSFCAALKRHRSGTA